MIAEIFIKRPVTAIVISILIVIIGAIAITGLPVSQYPKISPPTVSVNANYTGADAETVEQTVTTLIESQINGTPGMMYMSSSSNASGRSNITVTFDVGTDVDVAALDVQNRVSIAQPALPEGVRRLGVTTRKANTDALMMVALYSPNGTRTQNFLTNYVNLYVRDALMRVSGVGDVTAFGQPFAMRVWLDADKMANLNLTPADVNAAIQEQNMRMPGGSVGAKPQSNSQVYEFPVILKGDLNTEEEFENIVVKTNSDGSMVYLKDVARVELGQFSYSTTNKVNGMVSSGMMINQTPGGNAMETAEGVYAALEELKKNFPTDVDYIVSYETVSVIEASIEAVIWTLIEAIILVTIVVFIFLQSWRATLIPILAIPVSIIGTFIFFTLFGFSINNLTMLAFVLAIGIVVDDAIVVVEAVQHYLDTGKYTAKEATRLAMKDISGAVIAIGLILAAVFVPVAFIPGMVGLLYQQFAATIAVSVLISAFVALSLTPALCSIMLKPSTQNKESKGLDSIFYKFNNWFNRVSHNYGENVRYFIKKSPLVIIILVCIYVGTYGLFTTKSAGFIPNEDTGTLMVGISLPEGSSAVRTNEVLDQLEVEFREKFPEINNLTIISGMNLLNRNSTSSGATFYVQLKPWAERERSSFDIINIIRKEYSNYPFASLIPVSPSPIPGLGSSGGFSVQLLDQKGGDIKDFEAAVANFLQHLNQRPEVSNAYTLFNSRTPNYEITINREQVKKMGLQLNQVYSTLSAYLGSSYVNDFTRYGRNYRVVTQADTSFRMGIEDINKLYVKNSQGQNIPISSLVNYEIVEKPSMINHFNMFRSIDVSGNAAEGYSTGDAINAIEEVAAEFLSEGYSYEFSGVSLQEKQSGNTTILIFILCIVFVFLLLAALYESWSVPFSIMLSIPLGLFGAILTLMFLPHLDNNIYAQIGLITIIGLAAKNAILIVEFAKERVDRGMDIIPATIEAVKLRLRPIIMTSFAFILGIVPLMFSVGAGAISRQTIGWTVFGGVLIATLLAIFIVPVLFYVITKIAYSKEKLAQLKAENQIKQESQES